MNSEENSGFFFSVAKYMIKCNVLRKKMLIKDVHILYKSMVK